MLEFLAGLVVGGVLGPGAHRRALQREGDVAVLHAERAQAHAQDVDRVTAPALPGEEGAAAGEFHLAAVAARHADGVLVPFAADDGVHGKELAEVEPPPMTASVTGSSGRSVRVSIVFSPTAVSRPASRPHRRDPCRSESALPAFISPNT